MSGPSLLTNQNIFIGIIAIILLAALYSYSFSKTHWYDGLTVNNQDSSGNAAVPSSSSSTSSAITSRINSGNNPADLLPQSVGGDWSSANTNPDGVIGPSMLQAGYHIGLDTIGQTQKNPTLDIRSAPLIPKNPVSPWNNSTIEPDIGRIPFEIGAGIP